MRKLYWLVRSRPVFREASLFSVLGGALSFVSDVFGVFKVTVLVALFVAFGFLVAAIAWSSALLARIAPAELEGWAALRQTDPLKQHRPTWRLPIAADSTLFLLVTTLFLLFTYVGQQITAKRSNGDPSTEGLFATLVPAVAEMQRSMRGVRQDLGEIKGTLEKVKLETSEDPRKELANLGVAWGDDSFLDAVRDGDLRLIRLFLAGDINMKSAQSQGRPLPVMLALNQGNPEAILDLLIAAGLDPDAEYPLAGGMGPRTTTLIGRAIERGNVPLVRGLIHHRADLNRPVETFAAMGLGLRTYPLASAIRWEQYEIADLLLDAGADKAAGDYAAFRELKSGAGQGDQGQGAALSDRLAPTGPAKEKLDLQVQLQAVERELTEVAMKGIRAMPGSSEKAQLDRRYDELQLERARIRRALGEPL